MHGTKTKKALLKRVRITGNKRLIKRRANQNHFNARESGNSVRAKRIQREVPASLAKAAKHLLPNLN